MKVLECNDTNHNSLYLIELLNSMTEIKENYYWVIADLDLIPIFHGDYSGIGNKEKPRIVTHLLKIIEKDKIAILEHEQLMQVLDDTLSIRNAVIICLEKSYEIDLKLFRPTVESENKKSMIVVQNMKYVFWMENFFSLLQTKLLFAFIAIQWFEC